MSNDDKKIIKHSDYPTQFQRRKPTYFKGGKRSIKVLEELGFDPITELVLTYDRLQEELEKYEAWRDGTLVPLAASGRTIRYRAEDHMKCYDMLISVSDKLMRYGYGRVPEGLDPSNKEKRKPLTITLTDNNEEYKINVEEQPDDEVIDAEEDEEEEI